MRVTNHQYQPDESMTLTVHRIVHIRSLLILCTIQLMYDDQMRTYALTALEQHAATTQRHALRHCIPCSA
jgi:hypothetical protein